MHLKHLCLDVCIYLILNFNMGLLNDHVKVDMSFNSAKTRGSNHLNVSFQLLSERNQPKYIEQNEKEKVTINCLSFYK